MEIPQGNTLEKAQVPSPEAISGIADSLKLEEQKLSEWLSKKEGRKLTSQEEHCQASNGSPHFGQRESGTGLSPIT
jgi:hypothetical protein